MKQIDLNNILKENLFFENETCEPLFGNVINTNPDFVMINTKLGKMCLINTAFTGRVAMRYDNVLYYLTKGDTLYVNAKDSNWKETKEFALSKEGVQYYTKMLGFIKDKELHRSTGGTKIHNFPTNRDCIYNAMTYLVY